MTRKRIDQFKTAFFLMVAIEALVGAYPQLILD